MLKLDVLQEKITHFRENASSESHTIWAHLFEEALCGAQEGNYPVAAAVVNAQSEIVTMARNQYFFPFPHSGAHSEIKALDDFEQQKKGDLSDCTMFITLEPCLMCTSRLVLSGIKRVQYLLPDPAGGGIASMKTAPDDFRLLAAQISFEKVAATTEAEQIAQALYVLGEEIWKAHYGL